MRYNPFNPQVPARPNFFIGREPEIKKFEGFLNQTTHGSPMNMSVVGNRGMGKTSLVVKFEQIARENKCLVLRLSNYEGNISNITELIDFMCSNLKREVLARKPLESRIEGLKDWVSTLKPQVEYKDISLSFERKHIIQEMFRTRLIRLWNEIKKEWAAVIVLIDEAESLQKIEGVFTFLREVFQQMSHEAKFMLVLAGKLNFPERMSESFSPLNRFFPAHHLKPFTMDEVMKYLQRQLKEVEIGIMEDAGNLLYEKSEGHPYVLVAMSYLVFDSLEPDENKITVSIIERAWEKIEAQLAQDFFSPMYHPLTPRAKEILCIIATNANGLNFTFNEAVKWCKREGHSVSPYIQELLRKGVLNKPSRGHYEFFHSLFLDYVKCTKEYDAPVA